MYFWINQKTLVTITIRVIKFRKHVKWIIRIYKKETNQVNESIKHRRWKMEDRRKIGKKDDEEESG